MEYVDYYKILGLDKNASTEDIKKDYRQKKAVLYQQFLQALFDLEKAAAALMQRVSMHDNQS